MDSKPLPALFISHGSPMTAIEPGAAGAFLRRLGPALDREFGRPRAILAISAHTLGAEPVLHAAAQHQTVHDFGGFPPALYALRYDAAGSPALAADAARLLREAGIGAQLLPQGGLDHGIWTVLRHAYPAADIPIVPLAFVPSEPPAAQFALGAALAPLLRDGVLVLGTGSITHNLRMVFAGSGAGRPALDAPERPESAVFRDWFVERSARRDWHALLDYRRRAPHAVLMHPTDEHLLPWFAAAGAGGTAHAPLRLHESVTYGVLGMDAYAFGAGASSLATALAAEPTTA